MPTVNQQEVAPLHKHLSITINKQDYLPGFEKSLKEYSKKANIPGFRKGMVPTGLIKKMYGPSLFTDEVLKVVDREVIRFIQDEKLDIFAQPLPLDLNLQQLDVNQPGDYTFTFEVGMKPEIHLPNLSALPLTKYKVDISDEMVNEEVERLRTRHGNMSEPETVSGDDNVLNVTFVETDAEGNEVPGGIRKDNSLLVKYFREDYRQQLQGRKVGDELSLNLDEAFEDREKESVMKDLGLESGEGRRFKVIITKVGLVEARELNEDFFLQLFPNQEVKTEEEFRDRIRQELQKQWEAETRNQLHHSLYHALLENTQMNFPDEFLKRWLRTQGENNQPKSEEEVEQEFPGFLNQLKWTLIIDKAVQEGGIQVQQDDIRQFAREQLFGYMGMNMMDGEGGEQEWVRDYIDRMLKDRKYVEDAYQRIQTQKIFEWAESQSTPQEQSIGKAEFIRMNEEHQHRHHEG